MAHLSLRPEAEPREAFCPISTDGLPAKFGRPAAGGRRWSGRGASRQGGRPYWWPQRGEGSPEGFSMTEGIGGGARPRQAGVGVTSGV
jgi:hypothetical protein